MAGPALSVVIPTYDRPDDLRACLDGFREQRDAPPFEIVVVDDGSAAPLDDVVGSFAGELDLRLERRLHRGVAAARNVGVVLARAPLLILFDDDQRPLPGLVARCAAFHATEPDEGAFRLLRIVPPPGPRDAMGMAIFEGRMMFGYPRPGDQWGHEGFWGGAVTCKAAIFRYGLYDPAYPMVEDVELGLRLSRWLPLACHHDGVPDAVQMRALTVAGLARRWLRMSHCHLLWQRSYPSLVTIGQQAAYREAATLDPAAGEIGHRVAVLEAEAEALGRFDPAVLDGERRARLEDFLVALQALVRLCQATGWLAARRDEPLADMLARVLPREPRT